MEKSGIVLVWKRHCFEVKDTMFFLGIPIVIAVNSHRDSNGLLS